MRPTEYLSGDVQELLTEARKYRLGLTLAHQFVYQLEEAGEAIYHAVQQLYAQQSRVHRSIGPRKRRTLRRTCCR